MIIIYDILITSKNKKDFIKLFTLLRNKYKCYLTIHKFEDTIEIKNINKYTVFQIKNLIKASNITPEHMTIAKITKETIRETIYSNGILKLSERINK